MKVILKTISGASHELDVEPSTTIGEMKAMVAEKFPDLHSGGKIMKKVVYSGQQLGDDSMTIEATGMSEGAFFVGLFGKPTAPKPVAPSPPVAEPTVEPAAAPTTDEPTADEPMTGDSGSDEPVPGNMPIPGLGMSQDQMFEMMASMMVMNPSMGEQLMKHPIMEAIKETHPEWAETLVKEVPFITHLIKADFLNIGGVEQMLGAMMGGAMPGGLGGETSGPPPPALPELTEADMENINLLVGMGFTKEEAVEYYLIAEKNVDQAASMLFSSR